MKLFLYILLTILIAMVISNMILPAIGLKTILTFPQFLK
ncbi:MAG: hypothetical protein UR52_C0008G0032 [Candidatus Gottesmanbacteria bacterium GW2011_GWA1_34_13]|uniref:Uncharacterized protein n=1 Tax=Candidatus Gottesmanbacteria bacterium GW2011_GWA1_34_13 TaxID=1618434 RepID=A0A0G0DVZ3_9BACT|nr:MAG: hypothetical protein UR52_C0008G0032 [Candidatus Gottesmanbacteria bacterium GW2011_GWA1_34_13]